MFCNLIIFEIENYFMPEDQTQTTQIPEQNSIPVSTNSTREFINVPTADNSRLNKGLDEDIYGDVQYETKEGIKKSW